MRRTAWTPDLKRVYQRYPALVRSSAWPEIQKRALGGDVAGALKLAAEVEGRTPQFRAQNVFARRLRVERRGLFELRRLTLRRLQALYAAAATDVDDRAQRWATPGAYRKLLEYVRARMLLLRRQATGIVTDGIYGALKLGLRHTVDAVQPILDQNRQEARDLREALTTELSEGSLAVGLDLHGNAGARVAQGSGVWDAIVEKSYARIALKAVAGLTPARRIWDATDRARNGMQATIRTGLANGDGAPVVARRLRSFLDPEVKAGEENPGTGVYKNPYANAARVARTEMNKAYVTAQAEWAKSRSWVKGIMVTLSPAHPAPDECDDLAGEILDPDEFAAAVPVHPHCFCFGTYVVADEYLDVQAAGDQQPEEESRREVVHA